MQRSVVHVVLILLALGDYGCVERDDMCCSDQERDQLSGKWLLYEAGYSPGDRYITEAIPTSPAQTLTIRDHHVSSTVKGLEQIQFYRILNDTVSHSPYMAFYVKDPSIEGDTVRAAGTYTFKLENNILRLHFRWCIEGCHMAFRKIE